jgi:hypothetical protein
MESNLVKRLKSEKGISLNDSKLRRVLRKKIREDLNN